MNTLGTLLWRLVDYAGLFPPASLSMREAVRSYANHLQGKEQWALSRFILPAGRVAEFHAAREEFARQGAWCVSLLGTPEEAACALEENARYKTPAVIDTLECKASSPQEIEGYAKRVPAGLTAYFECPWGKSLAEYITACEAMGVRAKLRTGGLTAGMIPRAEELAHALVLCRKSKTPFKATAGLHHPIRSVNKLTYAPDAPTGTMHGFLNVFLAAALLWSGGSESDAAVTLRKDSPETFEFGENQVHWHVYTLSENQLRTTREQFAISFGSCSFEEPIDDLKRHAWL
jgi:hypothetical protein